MRNTTNPDRKEIEPLSLDWDTQAQVEALTDKLNEVIEAYNTANFNKRVAKNTETAKAMQDLIEKGYSIRKVGRIFGYKHPGSVKHILSRYLGDNL